MPSDPFGNATVRAMMHPAHQSPEHIGPAGPADPDLSLLSVQTPEGQPVAVLANYAMHYKGATPVSGDFCGRFGETLAERIGASGVTPKFVGIMSQGTSGDCMWLDYTRPPNDPGLDGYTQAVAEQAKQAYDRIEYHAWVPLQMAESRLTLQRRVPDAARLAWARQIAERVQGRLPQDQSEVYALEAIYLHDQPAVELKLQAVRIGDLGITALPAEVFGITGLKIKAQSPLPHTFNIELANGAEGYIPPPEQHVLGGYTTWPARTAGLEVQAEPQIVETLLGLLEHVSAASAYGASRRQMPTSKPSRSHTPWHSGGWTSSPARRRAMPWARDTMVRTSPASRSTCPAGRSVRWSSRNRPGTEPLILPVAGCFRQHHGTGRTILDRTLVLEWHACRCPAVTGHLVELGTGADAGDRLSLAGTAVGQPVLVFSSGSIAPLVGSTPLALRTWYQVVLVRDGSRVAVYLNGGAAPEIAGRSEPIPGPWCGAVFAGSRDRENTLEGKLDDIALYTRALTPAEIASHYAAAHAPVP